MPSERPAQSIRLIHLADANHLHVRFPYHKDFEGSQWKGHAALALAKAAVAESPKPVPEAGREDATAVLSERIRGLLEPVSRGETKWLKLDLEELGFTDPKKVRSILAGMAVHLNGVIDRKRYNVRVETQ